METFDYVVVGAGHNGLCAAATLAERGRSVVVVEQLPVLGGLSASHAYVAGAPEHKLSIGAMDDLFMAQTPLAKQMRLADFGYRTVPLAHPYGWMNEDGDTLLLWCDFAKALEADGPTPAWMVFVGGPNAPTPGGVVNTTMNLQPGHYVLVCFIPAKDGQPHLAKGMIRDMAVVGTASSASLPPSDATITLAEYSYAISGPITAGSRVIAVHNGGTQVHEAILVRLEPGKSVGDVLAWIGSGLVGAPPGIPIGGVSSLSPGGTAEFQITLTPGVYGLICVIPDDKDGKPHAVHGMLKQFTIT